MRSLIGFFELGVAARFVSFRCSGALSGLERWRPLRPRVPTPLFKLSAIGWGDPISGRLGEPCIAPTVPPSPHVFTTFLVSPLESALRFLEADADAGLDSIFEVPEACDIRLAPHVGVV